ncbi:hypothetical protein ACFL27_09345 [candidate division CSSED10-310 bacterium]|uniref:ABC transporter permease n=1 Tax=candidate division CSSED10-310 bacterium TaxID=2855610 RepID=A0ABV6YWA6_UNCC1
MSFVQLLQKVGTMDRRWIFLAIFVATVIPFFFPLGLEVKLTDEVKNIYDFIEQMDEHSQPILLSFDYAPDVAAECHPMALALLRHLFSRDIKVVAVALHQAAPALALDAFTTVAKEYNKKYGEDYAFMGFGAGFAYMMAKMGESFPDSFPADYYGTPIGEIPLARKIQNYSSVAMVITLSGSRSYEYYITFAQAKSGVKVAAGMTAVMASDAYPFLQSGQLVGLMGGLKAAAEYEQLVGHRDRAFIGMDAQSITHILIVFFIILGNVSYFLTKRMEKR